MDTIRVGVETASDVGSAEATPLICASCGAQTSSVPCADCGRNPLLRGRYRLLRVSGGDPTGMAYEAVDNRHTERPVEVRLLPLPPEEAPTAADLLQERVEQLRAPASDRIRPVYSAFLVGRGRRQAVAIVQPRTGGVRLESELGPRPMSMESTVELLDELLALVAILHSHEPPIPAGGLSPDRLHRRADGALMLPYVGGIDSFSDQDGPLRAPELAAQPWSPCADVYDAALLAVRLLTGRSPESMADPRGMLAWEHQTAAPTTLVDLLRRWLSPVPGERPVDASAARAELHDLRTESLPDPDEQHTLLQPRHAIRRAPSHLAVAPALQPATPRPGSPADPRRIHPRRDRASTELQDDPTQQRTRLITGALVILLLFAAIYATYTTVLGLQELF